MDDLYYIERSTGKQSAEAVYGRWALSLLYGSSKLSRLVAALLLPLLAKVAFLSSFYGFLQKRRGSRKKIVPFIEAFQVDATEFAEPVDSFRSFNDFFVRKIKSGCRPLVKDSKTAILPADGRYLVFPDLSKTDGFYVKGQQFYLEEFLQSSVLAHRFSNGSMVIVRLCPTDYHRFHFPVDGVPLKAEPIRGSLYSVNPVALTQRFSILSENKRMLTEIDSDQFGTVLMVEIGATFVGSIHQTYRPKTFYHKGDEKGYFSFGGSCIVLLFEKNRIVFDQDLAEHSNLRIETRGLFGTSLGHV
jgi:phosphatidylserine decarboxylase